MRSSPRCPIRFRVEALDTQHFVKPHLTRIIPPITRVVDDIPDVEAVTFRNLVESAMAFLREDAENLVKVGVLV